VFQYPRGKVVMTQPVDLPLVGKMPVRETTKEELLQFWQEVDQQHRMGVQYGEMVADITPLEPGFRVKTNKGEYEADTVLLAIGRRGTPRKLGVEGEELPKVVYRLIDPEQYRGQKVLIVGGGDSALEAALAIADVGGSEVSLSYRSESFSRAKAKNRERMSRYAEEGRITLYMKSNVRRISAHQVELDHDGKAVTIENDAIIINAGGILPTGFLKKIGIEVETKYGTA
jgi:thioredoxin reductase